MKNIRPIKLKKYANIFKYEKLRDYIYKCRADGSVRITLSCELEDGEDSQYPLEDVLDKFCVNVTDYFEEDSTTRTISFELEGSDNEDFEESFANILEISKLVGKRVYNKEDDGSVALLIE
jgi:hypothetical protein